MKKFILSVSFLMLALCGFSQSNNYGVRAGVNMSNLNFEPEPVSENAHRNGVYLGFFAEFGLSENLAIAPEIQYSAEGSKDEAFRVDYLQLPVLFKYNVIDNISIMAGPQASLKTHEYEDGFKTFGFSGVGGLEFGISDQIFIDLRYNYGLTNVLEDEVDFEAKNGSIQLGVTLKVE